MKNKLSIKIEDFWSKTFLDQKLNNWLGYVLIFSIAAVLGYLLAQNTVVGFGITGIVISAAVIITCLLSTEAGLYINVVYSFFAFHFSRFFFHDTFPVGVASDVLVVATLFSLFVRRISLKNTVNQFTKTSVAICILFLFFYLFIELFNPYAHSFEGWYQTFRKMLGAVFVLFVSFHVFSNYRSIKRFITLLFIVCTIAGIYGCIQQWHGLFSFERDWVMADANRFALTYIDGDFRKFSTMSDPTAYAIIMASCSIFFLVIAWNQKKASTKIILIIGSIFMLLGMAYSGTRTANAMVIGGLLIFILLTLNKKSTQIFAVISILIFLVLMYGPFYSSPTINRFRTTFSSSDASFNVREANRKFIQPYIYSHPFGGGLCTTGAGGLRFNPDHYLAGFPPDSGYLKKALETGWMGLALICILYFLITKTGIKGYFSTKNEHIKVMYAAATAAIFSFYVAEFSQDAIGQITDLVVYYPLIAIILKMKYFNQINRFSHETDHASFI
ncbi:MAG: O-antigen ligase family protein [Chitinophagaceae bacterium]